jgi:bla regulator protein BlaR1
VTTFTDCLLTSRLYSALPDHLWQSTTVGLMAWLLTRALSGYSARIRYAIWLFASIKFLVPFPLITYAAARFSETVNSSGTAGFYSLVEEVTRPIRQAPVVDAPTATANFSSYSADAIWASIGVVWFCGFAVLLMRWAAGWSSASRIARTAQELDQGREFEALTRARIGAHVQSPVPIALSSSRIEPAIFGIWRPVLLWPAGLSEELDDAQMTAIMVHEAEHVRRRDNLTAAAHGLVESLFWFHPLVWWMSRRLSEERERACDERVLEQDAKPHSYAASILKVCSLYVEPHRLPVCGISAADLKQRIAHIMTHRRGAALSTRGKCLLACVAFFLVAAPIGFGLLYGQSASSSKVLSWTPDMPRYEVGTIKPASADDAGLEIMFTPTGVELKDASIQTLLELAFGLEKSRILGVPAPMRSKSYDIHAKVSAEDAPRMSKLKIEQRRTLMLPFMEERFGLKYHHETREVPVYALVIAKGGAKLKESKPGAAAPFIEERREGTAGPASGPLRKRPAIGEGMSIGSGSIQSRGGNLSFLASSLSRILGRTVVDSTGLTGNYDFSLRWTPDGGMRNPGGPEQGEASGATLDTGGPTLFSALQEQLGLKLESQRRPVDVIVVDHLDLPAEN